MPRMTEIIIKQPESQQEFKEYYQLRWQLLAKPWHQPFEVSQDDKEATSYHLMALVNKKLAGISRLHFNTKSEAQIRYMGVIDTLQRNGIGSALVKALESYAKDQGTKIIVLNAREIAIPFYRAIGYHYVEEAHVAFNTIKHVKMRKYL